MIEQLKNVSSSKSHKKNFLSFFPEFKKKRTKVVHKNLSQGYYKVKLNPIESNLKKKGIINEKFVFKYENDLMKP